MAAQVLFVADTTPALSDLDNNTEAAFAWLDLVTTPSFGTAADGSAYPARTGANAKLTFDANFQLGFRIAPYGWGSAYTALDMGTTGGIAGDGSATYLGDNTYNNGTNDKAKTTNLGVRVKMTAGTWKVQIAPSVAAGATQTFADAVQVDASGNLIVGNNSSANPGVIWNTAGSGTIGSNASSAGYTFLNILRSGTPIGSITQSGTTAVLYNTTSDVRVKDNVQDAPEAGATIDAIQVRSFDMNGEHIEHGFVAQELVAVAPQAVKVGNDGAITEPEDVWGVDPSKLVALLIKEVQSLRARVAAVEAP